MTHQLLPARECADRVLAGLPDDDAAKVRDYLTAQGLFDAPWPTGNIEAMLSLLLELSLFLVMRAVLHGEDPHAALVARFPGVEAAVRELDWQL